MLFARSASSDEAAVSGLAFLRIALVAGYVVSGIGAGPLPAALIPIPNASFESPPFFVIVNLNIDSWQKSPKPDWYVEEGGYEWIQLVGAFRNPAPGEFDRIDNCNGNQAIWLFAVPEAGVFQDYDTLDWNDPGPTHSFNANYEPGKAYLLTVGVLVGTGAGGLMQPGVTLDLNLYYRDAASNRVAVATTTVTNTTAIFSNSTHLLDFSVNVPTVQAGDPWAGKHIGIEFVSTVSSNLQGGYWDLDNVRLQEISPPMLAPAAPEDGRFQFSLHSEPGLRFEIIAATNLWLPTAAWSSLGLVTNQSGETFFTDPGTNFGSRFYQARWLP